MIVSMVFAALGVLVAALLQGAAVPGLRIVSPGPGAVLHSTVVYVQLELDPGGSAGVAGFAPGRDGQLCVSVLWDKGKAAVAGASRKTES